MFVNYQFPDHKRFAPASTTESLVLAPGIRIAIDPGKGEIDVREGGLGEGGGLELGFTLAKLAPKWIELAIILPWEDWHACREIFLRYTALGSDIEVRPALRLGNAEGFKDLFSADAHLVREEIVEFATEFQIPPRWSKAATWMDLHLFFTPRDGIVGLRNLYLTGVR